MSHLPIKPVDHYLDKLENKHVLFVGAVVIVLLVLFGTRLSDLLYNTPPQDAYKSGYVEEHYPDGITRYPTVGMDEIRASGLFSTRPFVIPPYQDNWLENAHI